jgi:hypothetical protein
MKVKPGTPGFNLLTFDPMRVVVDVDKVHSVQATAAGKLTLLHKPFLTFGVGPDLTLGESRTYEQATRESSLCLNAQGQRGVRKTALINLFTKH